MIGTLLSMAMRFGAAKCKWVVPKTASKSSQYTLAFVFFKECSVQRVLSEYIRVSIIASHFANCEVNSSYCDCNVVNHQKNGKTFFSQGEFNSSKLQFSTLYSNDIHILFIHCKLLSKGVLLILKITSQNYIDILRGIFENICFYCLF